ncbi:hypothetical protein [Synechococcus elongatus]|uniref:hypothetical protein n=1 Tax=Synechococcus elongatus TaxID=32046 RepID=UPI000F6E371C|nr:hypothetical protein [Synechococcus elongatus]AZB72566.1 hypothetical protein DOP62_07415 [Synechococcus elongatus PCC 11801]
MQVLSLRTHLAEQLTAATLVTPRLNRDRSRSGLLYRIAPASVELLQAQLPPPWSVQGQGFVLPDVDLWQWLKARSQPWPVLVEPLSPSCPVWLLQLAHARCWQRCDTIAAVNPRWSTESPEAIAPVLWPVLAYLIDLADVWQGPTKPVLVIARDRLLPALDQLDRQPIPSLPRAATLDLYQAAAAALAACLQRWGQPSPRSL